MNRREFLKSVALASSAPLWVRFSAIGAEAAASAGAPIPDGLLLVLYLAGGNDGLNTVVPYLDPAYAQLRPGIGLKADEVSSIGGGLALHKSLARVHSMWQQGQVAVVHNVGYPKPNFSHFDSTYIWETASPDFQYHTGWLGRYLDATDGGSAGAVRAVAIGTGGLPRTLVGEEGAGFALNTLSDFAFADAGRPDAALRRAAYASFGAGVPSSAMHAKIMQAQNNMTSAVATVSQVAKGIIGPMTPAKTVAQMFAAGVGTQIGFISVGGFDTHTTQRGAHNARLAEVDTAIAEFFDAAAALGVADRATVVTFSDFGRRVEENASGGTDHGSSMPVLVMGPRVIGGTYGARPDLTALDAGNLVPAIHLGSVYSSLLAQAFDVDPAPIMGHEYPTLQLLG
ncbi:MAG: DUF1501 domain-containing protein [Actinomycetota bacterium]